MARPLAPMVLLVLVGTSLPCSALSVSIDELPGSSTDVPVFVPVEVSGPPHGSVELKAWLGSGDRFASRTWTGEAWQRSDWYAVDVQLDGAGAWSGWLAVQANPDSVNWPALADGVVADVGVRARADGRTADDLRTVPLHRGSGTVPVHVGSPGTVHLVRNGSVLFEAPVPSPLNASWVELPRLGDAALEVDGEDRPPAEGRLLGARPGPDGWVELGASGPVVVRPDRGPPLALEGPGRVPLHPDAERVELWSGVHLLDCIGWSDDQPGCTAADAAPGGWAVRDGDGGPWLEDPFPVGDRPGPLERMRVRGAVATATDGSDRWALAAGLIDGARSTIVMTAYTFTNMDLAGRLAAAAQRGVDVRLVVEPSPIGGRAPLEDRLLAALDDAGVRVRFAPQAPWPHGVLHAKSMVLDNGTLLVSTENWSRSGHPPVGDGNVGWSVAVRNTSLARQAWGHVHHWWRTADPVDSQGPSDPSDMPRPAHVPSMQWRPFDANVTLLVSPVNAWRPEGVPAAVAGASERVDLLLLRASASSTWTAAVLDAAARGVSTRVLVNGVPFDRGHDPWRDDGGAELAAVAAELPTLDVRSSPPRGPPVHAKGLIVDDRIVLVGSMNWVPAGQRMNREIGLLVEDPFTAGGFTVHFEQNWARPGTAGGPAEPAQRSVPAVHGPAILAALAAAWVLGRPGRYRRPPI